MKAFFKKFLDDFENNERHEDFLKECRKLNLLSFASQRYSQLEEAIGSDPIIEQTRSKIQTLAETSFKKEPPKKKRKNRRRRLIRPFYISLFVSAVIITIGFFIPEGRNLIGVGAALAFLTFAARVTRL